MTDTPPLHKLADAVLAHLKSMLSQNRAVPQAQFSEIPADLHKAYAEAFASPGAVGTYARAHWLSATGLNTGAAGALLQVLDENAASSKPKDLGSQKLVSMALTLKKDLPPEEKAKMEQIELLEPFLSDTMLLFTLLTTKKSQRLEKVISRWKAFGRDEHTLAQGAQRVRNHPDLVGVLKGTGRRRLETLLRLADMITLAEQITLLVDYHNNVMTGRGQSPWLAVDKDGLVKVHVRPMRMPAEADWLPGRWYNTYYLPQFKSLVRGYQGVAA
jgi:hypothetical protein